MREEIAILAGSSWRDNRKSLLSRAVDKMNELAAAKEIGKPVSRRMVKSLFYGEIDDDKHWAAFEIRRAVSIIEAQREASALASQLETIIGGLNVIDQAFHEPTIAALVGSLRKLRGQDST